MDLQTINFKMNPIRVAVVVLAIVGAMVVITGCSSSTDGGGNQPSGMLIDYSGCGIHTVDKVAQSFSLDQDCVVYEYDGEGTLQLTHFNAGFNCCTDLAADIDIDNNVITITETESGDYCHCLCLYNLEYSISNLSSGIYTVKFVEMYLPQGDDTLQFTLNLSTAPIGDICFDRSSYPWQTEIYPTGSLTDSSECKDYDTLANRSCFQWHYSAGTLSLRHINAVLNCCPVFVADVSIEGSNIIIEEIDSLYNGGCDCICCFDLGYEILNLPSGEYTITFLEPYLTNGDDILRYTVNLYFDPEGIYCVQRSNLPL
ncbi:MAG: hypothetical protein DRP47_08265 [Candidatus Zixiibacteriota bacterium]|nr:MAG: hypothetical protein DRP47_08265 [candidate division Zixibacteria bacterium]